MFNGGQACAASCGRLGPIIRGFRSSPLPAVQEVRARYFPNDPPVSSTIEITGLVNPDLVVEIDAIAVVDAVD